MNDHDGPTGAVVPLPTGFMAAQDPFIGREILNGQFQILQKIGSGGMGSVYRALQRDMNRMVGIKILHPKLANRTDFGRALPSRGARHEPADPPQHGEGLPVRRARGRPALHRHGDSRGKEPQPDGAAPMDPSR